MAVAFVRLGGTNSTKVAAGSIASTVPAAGHAAGDVVVVCVGMTNSSGALLSIADSHGGNTWTQLTAAVAGANFSVSVFWSKLTNALVSGDTITVSRNAGTFNSAAIVPLEFGGADSVVDVQNGQSNAGGSTTPGLASNLTTTDATDLAVGYLFTNGPSGDTFTNDAATWDGSTWVVPASSRTGTTGGSAASNCVVNVAYLITSAAGALNYKPALGTSRAWFDAVVALKASSTGTTFTETVTGGVSFTGAFGPTQTNKKLAATQSAAGTLGRAVSHGLSAALTLAGTVTKRTARTLSGGAMSLAGTIGESRLHTLVLSAAQAFTGTPVGKSTSRSLTAAATFTGSVARRTGRAISAAATFTGTVAKSTGRTLAAGSLTAAGTVSRQTRKGLTATATLAGTVSRSTARAITGGLSTAGTTAKQTTKALQAASLTFAGTVSRLTSRALTAAQLTLSGALASAKNGGSHAFTLTLTAALTASGVVQKQTGRALTAAQGLAGTVGRQTRRGLAAAASLTGNASKAIARPLVAAIGASGTLSSVAGAIRQALSAVASLAGSLVALLKPHAPGAVTSTVALLYQAAGIEQLAASAAGTEALTASLTSTSPLTAAVASSEQPLASITSTVTVLQ